MTARRGGLGRRLVLAAVLLALLEGALQLAAPLVRGAMDRGDVAPSADAAFTVLALGDSNTFGLNVPRLYSYPERLRALLEERFHAPVTVHNRGVPGQNGAQVAAGIERDLRETDPDLVLVLVGINDTWNQDAEDAGADLLGRLKLVRLARVLLAGVTSAGRFEVAADEEGRVTVDRGDGPRPVNAGAAAVGVRSGDALRESVRRALHAIVSRARAHGARVALMTYAESGGDFTTVNDALREIAAELGLPLVDHEAAFRGHVEALGYDTVMMNDHHPNVRGYALMAQGVLVTLDALGWLPEPTPDPRDTSPSADGGDGAAPALTARAGGRLDLSGPPGAPFQLLVARTPGPDDGFDVEGHRIPLPDDAALALARLEPSFSGRLGSDGRLVLTVAGRFAEAAGGPVAACLVVLAETPDGPAVRAVSEPVTVRD